MFPHGIIGIGSERRNSILDYLGGIQMKKIKLYACPISKCLLKTELFDIILDIRYVTFWMSQSLTEFENKLEYENKRIQWFI